MSSNADFDLASLREEEERAAAVEAARSKIKGAGSTVCVECGSRISDARRAVAPFAVRCVPCQTLHEQEKYHR